jgi:hypothetical protein
MSTNDQIILDQVVAQEHIARAPTASKSDFFELFVSSQVLKDFDLTYEEIESGLVAGGGDGGIDGAYIFANGELVQEDFDTSNLKKNIVIDVSIVQSKLSAGFDEETLNKFLAISNDLLDFSKDITQFKTVYNSDVLEFAEKFRKLYTELAGKFPNLRYKFFYASRGDSHAVHPNVSRKCTILQECILKLFSNAEFEFKFLGASDLLQLARRKPITSFNLNITEIISTSGGYITLVRIRDLYSFLKDEKDHLRKNLFEANVRDYQGSTAVNDEIEKTLKERSSEEFWWLNNGVTILASKSVQSGKTLSIEDPQIVNGLQTSTEIFNYFNLSNTVGDERQVLVRVITPGNPESSDKIIKATNSQTNIPQASLRATDKIHRDIEEYLKPFGLFYDRRKNMYKNQGAKIEDIVSIPLMAQAIMATCLGRPNDARARPSSLLKKDEDYMVIFSPQYPINVYLVAAKMLKAIQNKLRTREGLLPKDRNNILFHAAMVAAGLITKKSAVNVADLAAVKIEQLTDKALDAGINLAEGVYSDLGGTDQIAKGTEFVSELKEGLSKINSK